MTFAPRPIRLYLWGFARLLCLFAALECEFCGKFLFAFRKKYYLSGKYAVMKFVTLPKGR